MKNDQEWRENIYKTIEFAMDQPVTLVIKDAIDAAYVAGLDSQKAEFKAVLEGMLVTDIKENYGDETLLAYQIANKAFNQKIFKAIEEL